MGVTRVLAWTREQRTLRGFALASLVANVALVVSGGAVRLTNSGLGCPTWPSCTDSSLTPTKKYAIHGVIEFSNRQLTIVLALLAVLTLLVAILQRRQVLLAAVAFAIIPAQAVIGGIVVYTDLNPWVVSLHFLASMPIIAVTLLLWWRLRERPAGDASAFGRTGPHAVPSCQKATPVAVPARLLAWLAVLATAAVLVAGTVVTGSGPHAGDPDTSGKVHRTGLNVASMSQLHADLVMILVGLSVGLVAVSFAAAGAQRLRRATWVLFAVVLAQGVIGYTQYFLHVPPLLVALHMLGACLVWIAALRVLLIATSPQLQQLGDDVDDHAHQRAHHRAVQPDELKVTSDL